MLTCVSSAAHAQSYQDYMASVFKQDAEVQSEKTNKTPQANFFPGGRASTGFFENKSVTPSLPGPDRKLTYGTDQFHNPSTAPIPQPAAEPENKQQEVAVTEVGKTNSQDENWSANKNQETEEVKNFNENIEKASEQISNEPRVQDVLAQSKRIKEALFGKPESSKTNGPKTAVAIKDSAKPTKEIERF